MGLQQKTTGVLEVYTQCMRAACCVNLLQMRVSQSVVLREPRLWNKPEDLKSPCLSQIATRMERLPRSVRLPAQIPFMLFTLYLFLTLNRHQPTYLFAFAGPVSYSDRLLLVCHQWRQASEWLLCAKQDPGVFRYLGWKPACKPVDEMSRVFQKNHNKTFVLHKVSNGRDSAANAACICCALVPCTLVIRVICVYIRVMFNRLYKTPVEG